MKLDMASYDDPNAPEEFRATGIGGGDVGAIWGVSPYKTAYQLWQEKTGQKEKPDLSGLWQIEKGKEMEVKLRELYEFATGNTISPAFYLHDTYRWMKAALDGITADESLVVEFKFVGEDLFTAKVTDKKLRNYILQCQHYLIVTGAKRCDLVLGVERKDGKIEMRIIPVRITDKEAKDMIQVESDFMNCIWEMNPPAKSAFDTEDMTQDNEFRIMAAERIRLEGQIKELTRQRDLIDKELKQKAMNLERSVECPELKITRYWQDGNLDHQAFVKSLGYEDTPEEFRKKGSYRYRITPAKEAE